MLVTQLTEVQPRVSPQWTFTTDANRPAHARFNVDCESLTIFVGRTNFTQQDVIVNPNCVTQMFSLKIGVDPEAPLEEIWSIIEPEIEAIDLNGAQ